MTYPSSPLRRAWLRTQMRRDAAGRSDNPPYMAKPGYSPRCATGLCTLCVAAGNTAADCLCTCHEGRAA